MSQEKMISHTQSNYLNYDHKDNDYLLQTAANSKTKRVNRNDNTRWELMWGPPL